MHISPFGFLRGLLRKATNSDFLYFRANITIFQKSVFLPQHFRFLSEPPKVEILLHKLIKHELFCFMIFLSHELFGYWLPFSICQNWHFSTLGCHNYGAIGAIDLKVVAKHMLVIYLQSQPLRLALVYAFFRENTIFSRQGHVVPPPCHL